MESMRVLQCEEEIDTHPDIIADHVPNKSDGDAGNDKVFVVEKCRHKGDKRG